jgi:hypothetical protein
LLYNNYGVVISWQFACPGRTCAFEVVFTSLKAPKCLLYAWGLFSSGAFCPKRCDHYSRSATEDQVFFRLSLKFRDSWQKKNERRRHSGTKNGKSTTKTPPVGGRSRQSLSAAPSNRRHEGAFTCFSLCLCVGMFQIFAKMS